MLIKICLKARARLIRLSAVRFPVFHCFTGKKTTKEKRKEAAETFDLLTKKDANSVKLSGLPVEHRSMHLLPKVIGEDKVRIYCFETEELKTEFDTDDDEIAKLFSEAMARLKNLQVKYYKYRPLKLKRKHEK